MSEGDPPIFTLSMTDRVKVYEVCAKTILSWYDNAHLCCSETGVG